MIRLKFIRMFNQNCNSVIFISFDDFSTMKNSIKQILGTSNTF